MGTVFLPGAFNATPASAAAGAPSSAHAQSPLSPAQAASLSKNSTDHVVVVFKNQETSIPDTTPNVPRRASAEAAVQAPVLHELSQVRAGQVAPVQLVNAVSATVSPAEAARLAANPAVAQVVKDEPIPLVGSLPSLASSRTQLSSSRAGQKGTPLAAACAANGQVQLDPQAIETIHAAGGPQTAQGLGYTGAGVKVAFIADGLDINNPDFIRPDGAPVFVDYQDFSGTGTSAPTSGAEAFLDASSIAAQGRFVYNVQNYGLGLPQPCNIRILGVAPGASLVGLNVFGSSNIAYNSVFLAAINYAINVDHVNVINESFGGNPFPDQASLDLTRMANEAAVAAGVTVTVASGDSGVTNTIGSPATDPAVISAGASTTYRAYAQVGLAGINLPGVQGWLDNNISALSSAGFDQTGATVDVVAPGDLNWALCTPDPALYAACTDFSGNPSPVQLQGGTSEAAPLTAGVAALVIQAYEKSHGGTPPTPAVVKQIIVSTAEDISAPADQQGAGLLDAYTAVQAAASYPGGSGAAGTALIKGTTQLNAVGSANSQQTFTDTVTNTGTKTQTVQISSRTLSAYRTVAATTVQLQDATGNLALVQFSVPPGQGRLNASISYVANGALADDLSLFTPSGYLAEFSLPEGLSNYSNAQVADPQPGVWTALIFGQPSTAGGSVGPVQFGAATASWAPFGFVSPSHVTLAPGATASVHLAVRTPSTPGDQSGSLVFTSNAHQPDFAGTTTVPVTLRSLIPTPNPVTAFVGTLTGGNGRATNTGQTAYYQVQVPAGLAELNASVKSLSSANTFVAELIDPVTGEAASTAASALPGISSTGETPVPEAGAQLHVQGPDPGLWTVAINFYGQVSGTAISQPFLVTLNQIPVPANSSLPDSASTVLKAGRAETVFVRVRNTGNTPEAYFVDARLNSTTTLNLAPLTTATTPVPITGTPPVYLVPTHTTSVTAAATAPAPIYFDFWWAFGDPDLISSGPPSNSVSGTFSASPVVAGQWGITPFQQGPDGANGVPVVTAATTMTATTAAFDPSVTSTTGDLWLQSANPAAALAPVIVGPGQSAVIPVVITPSGTPGTTVTGTLYVDDVSATTSLATDNETAFTQLINQASDVVAIPYSYTIG
jgi:subtilisin family serine protease